MGAGPVVASSRADDPSRTPMFGVLRNPADVPDAGADAMPDDSGIMPTLASVLSFFRRPRLGDPAVSRCADARKLELPRARPVALRRTPGASGMTEPGRTGKLFFATVCLRLRRGRLP